MNIQDIARLSGVSVATVSRMINQSGYVKETTRKKIEHVIKQHNYVPNAVARSLSISDTSSVGVIIADVENHFFFGIISGICEIAEKMGIKILFFGTNETINVEHAALKTVQEQRLKGVIVTPISEEDSVTRGILRRMNRSGIPVVLVDREFPGEKFDSILTDNVNAAYEGVQALVRAGHTRIATIAGPTTSKPGKGRLQGYKMALEEAGIEIRQEYIKVGDFKREMAYNLTEELLDLPQPPTAIFTSNNMTTLGCLGRLTQRHIRPNRDIAVLGFDGIEELNAIGYNLPAIERDTKQIGREAMMLLAERLAGGEEQVTPECIMVPYTLNLRGVDLKI